MNLAAVQPVEKNDQTINVVIETPSGSQYKYAFDQQLQIFKVKKILPVGSTFPFDFGFIPNTKGGDGDPLDVLVIADQKLFAGCLLSCRLLGMLEATQHEKDKEKQRNDRIIAVAESTTKYADVKKISDLNKNMISELENFFIYYNKHDGKIFTPKKWVDAAAAMNVIIRSIVV